VRVSASERRGSEADGIFFGIRGGRKGGRRCPRVLESVVRGRGGKKIRGVVSRGRR